MQALSQSSFLQALGYAIANSFWQVALLWLITVVISACFKLSSHNRYRVAITAQLAGFAWFVITLQFYYQQCTKAAINAQMLLENNTVIYQPDLVNNKYNILSYIAKAEMLLPYLSLAYLCLLCVMAVRWFKSYRYTSLLKHDGLQKADMDLRLFVQEMAAQLGIRHKVKIYLSTLVTCPLTVGFFKPIILVPVATINCLTTQQLEAVLLHELAHIRRADYIINLLLNVIEIILFFNPFTRLIGQLVTKEREHCCDDWVLQFKYSASMYAEALLRIACLQASPTIAMKAEGRNGGELLWRVKRLLNHKQKNFNYSQQMIALVVTTCLLLSIAWLQPSRTTNKQPQQAAATATKPVKAVVVAPMAAQINNPFFSPFAFFAKPLKEKVKEATQEIVKTEINKVIDTSLKEASKALTEVTPTVIQELNKFSDDKKLEQATKDVQKELKKVKWSEVQQLSPFIDSAFISNAVNMALDKGKLTISLEKAKQSLEAYKQQLAKLSQVNTEALMNLDYINAAINNANVLVADKNFVNIWNENRNAATATPALRKQTKERKEKQRQQALLLRKLLKYRRAPRVETYTLELHEQNGCNKTNNNNIIDHADEISNYTYTNPVYKEIVPDDDNDSDEADSICSYAAQSEVEVQSAQPTVPLAPAKPSVHVLEVTNPAQGVSIIITIREE